MTPFHADTTRIDEWTDTLRRDAYKQHHANADEDDTILLRGVPALLTLARTMVAQNPDLRPSALEVREGVERVLGECGVEGLCCWGRVWEGVEESPGGPGGEEGGGGAAEGEGRRAGTGVGLGVRLGARRESESGSGSGSAGSEITRTDSRVDVRSLRSVKSGRTLRLPWKRGPVLRVP